MICYVLGAENILGIKGIVGKVFSKTVKLFLLWGYSLILFFFFDEKLVSLKVWLANKTELDKCLNLGGIINHVFNRWKKWDAII